jgi:hypothetical protein
VLGVAAYLPLTNRLLTAYFPLTSRLFAAYFPLTCRFLADAVWVSAVWGSSMVATAHSMETREKQHGTPN